MITPPTGNTDLLLDLKALQEDVIPIETEHFERAVQISKQATSEARRWQTYLNVLALCGLEQWLNEQASDLPINQDVCSVLQPQYANVLHAVCNLRIGELNLCLIVTESLHEVVTVPRAVIDLPEFAAHLYVLLEVQEEQEQVIIRGCLRYDQLVKYQQAVALKAGPDWNYQLPLDLFNPDASHLVFFLRFLDSTAISLPAVSESVRAKLSRVQTKLEKRLPQLHPNSQLWQVLTWEQGAAVLTCPPLLNLLYLLQTKPEKTAEITKHLTDVIKHLVEQVVNVWHWSEKTIDELIQLGWSLPRSLTPASAMRRVTEKVEVALKDLVQAKGVEIPPQSYYSYKSIAGTALQICAVTWMMPPPAVAIATAAELELRERIQSWALLLILVAQPGSILPRGIKLQVGVTTVLSEVVLEQDDLYLYLLIEGSRDEELIATILPPHELPLTLPAFICHSGQ